jgi:hypothetical protein
MGIFDRLKRQTTAPTSEAEPPVDAKAEPATESLIPERDVRKTARWTKFDANEHERRNIPEGLECQDGPLGTEKPYSIVTEGFHKYVKNKRPGTELELTLRLRWISLFKGMPEDSPVLDVFLDEQQIGTMEMQRGGWFAPAVELAEKFGVAVKAGGAMAMWGERREPFIYLPDPQKFYDYLRSQLLAQVGDGAHVAH